MHIKHHRLAQAIITLAVVILIGSNVWLAQKNNDLKSEIPTLKAQIEALQKLTPTPTPAITAPKITQLTPTFGSAGTNLTVKGSGFNKTGNILHIDWGIIPDLPSNDGVTLTTTIPEQLTPECAYVQPPCTYNVQKLNEPGRTYKIYISNTAGRSEAVDFLLTKAPATSKAVSITELKPTSGPVATIVTIAGKGFLRSGNTVVFGYHEYKNVSSKDGKTLSFAVPAALIFPCKPKAPCPTHNVQLVTPGPYAVYVYNNRGTSNVLTFTVTQ